MSKSWKEPLLPEWLTAILPAAVVLGFVMAGSACWSYVSCDEKGEVTGRQVEWRLISGCYIQVEGRWIPVDSWRGEQDGVVKK